MKILALESSCDETAAAITEGRKTLSSSVYSQISEHRPYGGVVPEIASRRHVELLPVVVNDALEQANLGFADIDAVAVTNAPGLIGALLCSVSYAKGVSLALRKPLIAVNHILGHISAAFAAFPALEPPFIALVASGGHSHIYRVSDYCDITLLGATRDDAAGEAFDKSARVLGLGYPGGPAIDAAAKNGDASRYTFRQRPLPDLELSFSGLKTGLIQKMAKLDREEAPIRVNDLAASFQQAIVDQLLGSVFKAVSRAQAPKLVICGGVACNSALREQAALRAKDTGTELFIPPPSLCGDNAIMIGVAAYHLSLQGRYADLHLDAQSNADDG